MLDTQFISGSTKWETVKTGIKAALNNNVDGIPWVQLSRSEFHLNKALRGGWHYRKSNSGVISDKPIKNIFSHPGDAFAHLCCYLLEMGEGGRKRRLDLSYGGWRQQSLLNSNSGWMVS